MQEAILDCGCNTGPVTSWIGWAESDPVDPLSVIAMARIENLPFSNDTGVYLNSTTYGTPGASWVDTTVDYNGEPTVVSLRTDRQGTVAEALQWNMAHLSRNASASLAIPLRKVIFLKAGTEWENRIILTMGGKFYNDFQLSLLNNAGTRGDEQGTVPVLSFTASTYVGTQLTLAVSIKTPGVFRMGLRGVDQGGDWSMFEMLWVGVG